MMNRFNISKSLTDFVIWQNSIYIEIEKFSYETSLYESIFYYKFYNHSVLHNTSDIILRYFFSTGISSLTSCGTPEELPELPPHDEQRLRRAARLLQQRLVLREWLVSHRLHHAYTR